VSLILLAAGCLLSSRPTRDSASTLERAAILDEPALVRATAEPGAGPAATPARPPSSIAELRARVAEVLEREQVPGAGLALVDERGLIWAGGVGVADLDSKRPVDADTVFRVASITKSFVALGVMRLVEQGRLELDEPLRELMPEVEIGNRWASSDPITLAHALEHSAGFDDMRFNEWFGDDDTTPREALAINPRSREARWRPGSRMSYSNPGYTIAGHAIELATGEAWDRWLEREVLARLGMHTARFRRTPQLEQRLAMGYSRPGEAAPFLPLAHAPAGSLLASPRELAQLVHFWLRRGAPLPSSRAGEAIVGPASLARIERTETLPYPGTDASYGLGNYGDVGHAARARGHDGGLPGFLSAYRYFPELGVGYVMLLNGAHSPRAYVEIRALLFAYLARGRELPEPPRAPPDGEAIAAATGYYGFANPRIELFAFLERMFVGLDLRPAPEGIELELLTGGRIRLVPTGEGGFRHPLESGTSIRLAKNAEGRRILLAPMSYFEAGSGTWARARLRALQGALLLIQLSLVWGLGWLLVAAVRRLRGRACAPGELTLQAWPALASLSFVVMLSLAQIVAVRQAFTSANPLSIALCLATLVFPACSAAALTAALREALGGVLPLWSRAVPSAAAVACFGMSLWLLANNIVGLRPWAW
jgi:CubicO group peptidase (beta-lactamase class C family)